MTEWRGAEAEAQAWLEHDAEACPHDPEGDARRRRTARQGTSPWKSSVAHERARCAATCREHAEHWRRLGLEAKAIEAGALADAIERGEVDA